MRLLLDVVDKSLKGEASPRPDEKSGECPVQEEAEYMAVEFKPSAEVTDGAWFSRGAPGQGLHSIDVLKQLPAPHFKTEGGTVDMICTMLSRGRASTKLRIQVSRLGRSWGLWSWKMKY
ncbi:hypothetical protein CRG98_006110 [Punica granatum]|uniref:Uncharacterized protein n=1 Tax=Punica granatum TaxID=22663 RepID=A0A2I0KYI6_PUNGR|nr:hypothetical protein CRG98_006110 [Punica granatum]